MKNFELPTLTRLKSWLDWELQGLLNRGWSELTRLFGLFAIAGVFITAAGASGTPEARQLVQTVVTGFVGLLLLHPFLRCGEMFTTDRIPRGWFSTPKFPRLLIFSGVARTWLLNFCGLLIFVFLLTPANFSFSFLLSPYFWLLFLLLVPGAVGCGLLIHGFQLFVETSGSVRWGVSRLIEFLGGVFVRPAWLVFWLYPVHFLVPHSYLTELGRTLNRNQSFELNYYLLGVGVSLGLCLLGTVIFFRVLDDYVQSGRLYTN